MAGQADVHHAEVSELRDFVDNLVAPLHWVDGNGFIVWANQAELDLLGYGRDEYVGHHIAEFHADREVIDDILARLTANETLRNVEARLRHKDGSIRHVLISSSVFRRDGEFVHTRCLSVDVTERRRLEERRVAAERNLAAQYAVTRVLADAATLPEATGRILQAVGDIGGWSTGAIWVLDEAERTLRCADFWQARGVAANEFEAVTRELTLAPGAGLPGRVWATGAPAWVEDVARDGNFPRAPYAAAAGLRGALCFPIRVRDRVIGAIEFFSRVVRGPDPDSLHLFTAIGAQIGGFLERRQAHELQTRLAAIVDSSDDAIVSKTLDGVITSWNRGAQAIFGYTPAEAVGRHISLIIPPERLAEEDEVLARLRRGERIDHYETERMAKDGRRLTISLSVSPIRDADGQIVGAAKVARDITETKRAQAAIAESERRFRLVADSAPVLIWVNEANGGCEFVNKAYLDFYGCTLAEVQGANWQLGLHPEDAGGYVAAYQEATLRRLPFRGEVRMRRADGEYRWMESYALPRHTPAGDFVGYVGVTHDLTDRKRAEDALRRSEQQAQMQATVTQLLNRVGGQVASSLDRDSIVQTVTDIATELTEAQFGAFFYNVVDPQSGESYLLYTLSGAPKEAFSQFPKPRATALFGPTFRGEKIIRVADITQDPRYGQNPPYHGMPRGHLPVKSYMAVPVRGRVGDVLGALFFGHSEAGVFTEQHELMVEGVAAWASVALENARLYARAESAVAARDEFLAMAAHELRNPLNALQLQLVGLLRRAQERETALPQAWVCERIGQATEDVARLVQLVHNLLDVSAITAGRIDLDPEDVELSDVVRTAAARFAPQVKDGHMRIDAEPVAGRWDRLRVDQIVTNLVSNAVKYGGGQPIDITVRAADGRARVSVADRGIGITAEGRQQLFKRFERGVSRRHYGGFGLGLWITARLVEAMGGEIAVDSEPGAGSTFTVTLPLAPAGASREAAV